MGDQSWVEKNDSGHKNSFFKIKPVFRGYIVESDLFPSFEENFVMSYLQN